MSGHSDQMSNISVQLLISGQFQDNCEISGISGQLGALTDFAHTFSNMFTQQNQPSAVNSVIYQLMYNSIKLY